MDNCGDLHVLSRERTNRLLQRNRKASENEKNAAYYWVSKAVSESVIA
ncbi:hypothetical protein ACLIBH_05745 [Virgibacillus sp. W0430]